MSTGRFYPAREWTCPDHDSPESHDCDCQLCTWEPSCAGCEAGKWVDKLDENGEVVMREMSPFESILTDGFMRKPLFPPPLIAWIIGDA